jgi:hypothetical protein
VAANRRKHEIEKTVSLLRLDPAQVLSLRAGSRASFRLTEAMFDIDFPGHYARQITSVSISIPVVGGPYESINGTLVQESSCVVTVPDKAVVDYLIKRELAPGRKLPAPSGLRESGTQTAAISLGVIVMPFEGTGAVSRWTLSIPPESNRFDLTQLTDVVMTIRYTAQGSSSPGDEFRNDVIDVLEANNVRYQGRL